MGLEKGRMGNCGIREDLRNHKTIFILIKVYDGSEITEVVSLNINLHYTGNKVSFFAPNIA